MERVIEFILNHPLNVGAFIAMLTLWGFYELRRSGKAITTADLIKKMNTDAALVVDLRPEKEYRIGHITSSLNWPYERIRDLPDMLKKHKKRPTVLVCGNGRNSAAAQILIKKQGYEAERLGGGLLEWEQANLPLVK